ncbi:MAG: sialidase family protein, partial [Sphaerochaetaceae bacterium]|nr:sialidase family protein [Sphaerochaetaceae bacterium]
MFKFQQTVLVKDGLYNSFPSVTRAHDGSIILVYRQADNSLKTYGAVTHVDASSRIAMKISRDNGASWSDSTVIYNDEMGENDPCINTLSDYYGEVGQMKRTSQAIDPDWAIIPVNGPVLTEGQQLHLRNTDFLTRNQYDAITTRAKDEGLDDIIM